MLENEKPSISDQGQTLLSLLGTIFSAIVLTALGVIISGKLIAKRAPLNLSSDDHFTINLLILKLRSTGDEVVWGFVAFLLALVPILFLGGAPAYEVFRDRSGIDIGQWNSLCFLSSSVCILVSVAIWALAPLFRSRGIVTDGERSAQLKRLNELTEKESDGDEPRS